MTGCMLWTGPYVIEIKGRRSPFKALFGFDANHKDADQDSLQVVPEIAVDEEEHIEDNGELFHGPEEEYVEDDETAWEDKTALINHEREQFGLALQADKMLQASKSRYTLFSELLFLIYGAMKVGKSVLVAIPEVDRPKAGTRSLMAVVLQERDGFYKLGTPNGRLPHYFARNQVEPLEECFVLQSGVPDVDLPSFRAAISLDSVTGSQGHKHCNCNDKCDSNRCSCKGRNLLCNSRCHKTNSSCNNK